MADDFTLANVRMGGGSPMSVSPALDSENTGELAESQQNMVSAVGGAFAAYVKAAENLLNKKLAHLKDWAPPHLASRVDVLVACCPDGVVTRYDSSPGGPGRVVAAWMPQSLPQVAALLSEKVISIGGPSEADTSSEVPGVELRMVGLGDDAAENRVLCSFRIRYRAVLPEKPEGRVSGLRPMCLCSIRNTVDLFLRGETIPEGVHRQAAQSFLIHAPIRLPVGWDCIEVFPATDPDAWNREAAATWAELDILGSVASRQIKEDRLSSLDPNASARQRVGRLLDEFRRLLEGKPSREEDMQQFLAANPQLLCPASTRVWPKLALGKHVTDFVFREAVGDYLLVELENSTDRLLNRSGHPASKLTHARGQIQDWRRYVEDNLRTVQSELGLTGISTNPRALVVMGRSAELSVENRRKLMTIENESPRVKIMTYDDVIENAKAVYENLLGPLWNVEGSTRIYYLGSETTSR